MTWQFYGGTLDPEKRTRENSLFAIATEPRKLRTMMDELDTLPPEAAAKLDEAIRKMEQNRQAIIMGQDRLVAVNKRVGERIKLYGINYRDIDLELEIVGTFPEGRYDNTAAVNRDYLLAALDAYQRQTGKPHPLADKTLNLVWLRVPDTRGVCPGRRPDPVLAELHQSGGQVRDGRVGHGVVSGCLSRSDLGHALAVGAGAAVHAGPGDLQCHQHQRPRTADRSWPC